MALGTQVDVDSDSDSSSDSSDSDSSEPGVISDSEVEAKTNDVAQDVAQDVAHDAVHDAVHDAAMHDVTNATEAEDSDSDASTMSRAPSSCETIRGAPREDISDGGSTTRSSQREPIPRERNMEDVLLNQQPQDIRMYIFDNDPSIMIMEPLSPAEHVVVDECGTTDADPWHSFELPITQAAYAQCFAKDIIDVTEDGPTNAENPPLSSRPSRHYQHVLQRAVGNFAHLVKLEEEGAKVMSCGTEEMQATLTKYIKLIVLKWTRKYFFVKPEEHNDLTMMYIPQEYKEEVNKMLRTVESVTGTLILFFDDGPDVEARDVRDRWRKAKIDRLVNKDSVSVIVGKRRADILIEDVRPIEREPEFRIPLAIFATDETKRLICVAHILQVMGDIFDTTGSTLPRKHMLHPKISLRKYPPEEEKVLISLSAKFERPLSTATNCSVIVAKSQNIAILIGNSAEKQLCATYIQCMMDKDVPSRADALLMPRPEGFHCKLPMLIKVGETTKTLVFIKSDKVVLMSPSFLRRTNAFLHVANLAEEMDPGYVERSHFPTDSAGIYKITEMDAHYTRLDANRRCLYEKKLEQLSLATGGAVAIVKTSAYSIGTEEARKNILQYTRWFFVDPSAMTKDRTGPGGKDALCVSIHANVMVPDVFYHDLAKRFKVFSIPYPGMEHGQPVTNVWLVGPSRDLTSAATCLRWCAQLEDPTAMIPIIHTAPAPMSQPTPPTPQVQPVQPMMMVPQYYQPQMNPLANSLLLLQAMHAKRRRL